VAIPASYTELSLAEYMVTVTRNVAAALGWTSDDFLEAVNDTLTAYGESAIDDATDVTKLRTLAKVEAWRAVVDGTAADIEFTADGSSFKRNQMHAHAVAAMERAESAATAAGYGDTYAPAITLGTIYHSSDPYLTDESLYEDDE
jgi:hypothetical protein